MSYISIWLHCVWTTKERKPYLADSLRPAVISHIQYNAKLKGIYIDEINGYLDHLHMLVSLGRSQNISEVMQKIKGESSYWINKNKLTCIRFEWQDDFYCISVGYKQLHLIRDYIRNQEIHHKKTTWEEEISRLKEENNIQIR